MGKVKVWEKYFVWEKSKYEKTIYKKKNKLI